MNLILVQYRPAVRLYKWAVTLQKMGHEVTVCYTEPPVEGLIWDRFNMVEFTSIHSFSGYNYYISFNPGLRISHTAATKVIQAVGDLRTVGAVESSKTRNEMINLNASFKNVFISETQRDFAVKEMMIDPGKCHVVENGIIDEFIGERKPKIKSDRLMLVYQGTITDVVNHRNIAQQLIDIANENDCEIHIYPSSISTYETYIHKHIFIHSTVSPYELVSELSQYDAGLILVNNDRVGNMCLPNKFHEYIAAGLPIISPRWNEMEKANDQYECVYFLRDNIIPFFPRCEMHRKPFNYNDNIEKIKAIL